MLVFEAHLGLHKNAYLISSVVEPRLGQSEPPDRAQQNLLVRHASPPQRGLPKRGSDNPPPGESFSFRTTRPSRGYFSRSSIGRSPGWSPHFRSCPASAHDGHLRHRSFAPNFSEPCPRARAIRNSRPEDTRQGTNSVARGNASGSNNLTVGRGLAGGEAL